MVGFSGKTGGKQVAANHRSIFLKKNNVLWDKSAGFFFFRLIFLAASHYVVQ